MADYTFSAIPAWGQPGQFARLGLGAGKRFPVTIPGGGAATVVQGGVTQVGFLLSDAHGMIPSWTAADILSVDVDFGIGVLRVNSEDAITAGGASAAAAASSATDASNSATAAASSASDAATSASDAAASMAGKVSVADRPVSLRGQSGIDWTGGTDSTTAVQAVITAAGVGAKIDMGKGGVIRLDGGLTLQNFQTLEGVDNFIGAGVPTATELKMTGMAASGVGITCGVNNTLRGVILRGPGYTASGQKGIVSTSSAPRFERCGFYSWPIGVSLTGAYYTVFDNCDWQYNAIGLLLSGCYDLDLIKPKFRCSNEAGTTFGQGINTGTVRGLNVFGGSIENFGPTAGIFGGAQSIVNCFGTYFESAGSSGFGIDAGAKAGMALGLYGCLVYLTDLSRWVNFGGGAAQSLKASGNKFVCPTTSTTTPLAYALSSSGTSDVDIAGDNWADVLKGTYLGGSAVLPRAGFRIAPPIGATGAGTYYLGLVKLVQQAAQADTSGATLAALETEVNGLKAKLRTLGLMA